MECKSYYCFKSLESSKFHVKFEVLNKYYTIVSYFIILLFHNFVVHRSIYFQVPQFFICSTETFEIDEHYP